MANESTKSNLSPEAQAQLADLAVALAHHPKMGKQFKKMVSEIDPTKRFLDVESEDLKDEMRREFEKRDQAAAADRVKNQLEAQKNSLRDRYDDKALGEIEKIMEKHGISDYDIGAKIYASDLKPAEPSYEVNDHKWNLPPIDIKDFGNLRQIQRQRAYQAIDDLKRKRPA